MSNQELSELDLSQVAPLQQKRTLAFANHFVVTTVQFLNNFMKNCEHKLMHFERKLEKVEAAMILLEARLSSIPEVNSKSVTKQEESPSAEPEHATTADQNDSSPEKPPESQAEEPSTQNQPPAHPEYDRFLKMVQVGVPLPAVKLKISSEGLDPSVFEQILGNK